MPTEGIVNNKFDRKCKMDKSFWEGSLKMNLIMSKWESLKMGNSIVADDAQLDALIDYVDTLPDEESKVSNHMRSMPNPSQVGTKDRYLTFLGYYLPQQI